MKRVVTGLVCEDFSMLELLQRPGICIIRRLRPANEKSRRVSIGRSVTTQTLVNILSRRIGVHVSNIEHNCDDKFGKESHFFLL